MWDVHVVHHDVLKMAQTEAQRDAIVWFHARHVFFELAL